MFEIKRNPYIKIDLLPGVYTFMDASGIGKTWLYRLFYMYEGFGEQVACYTYRDYKMRRNPTREFQTAQAIMIDRYDLYKGYLDDIISTLAGKIILIDCKNRYAAREHDKLCKLQTLANGIEVYHE